MNTTERNNEIRELLGRWYAGESSPRLERRLSGLFAEADSLPADLEADRRLFMDMSAADVPVTMPDDVSERIESAIEREMARDRRGALRRRLAYIVSAAAAVAAVAGVGFRFTNSIHQNTPAARFAEKRELRPVASQTADTLIRTLPMESGMVADAPQRHRAGAKCRTTRRKASMPVSAAADAEAGPVVEEFVEPDIDAAERERLIACGYNIIDDEDEAEAIAGAVFMKLDSRMAEVASNIDAVNADLTMEYVDF